MFGGLFTGAGVLIQPDHVFASQSISHSSTGGIRRGWVYEKRWPVGKPDDWYLSPSDRAIGDDEEERRC